MELEIRDEIKQAAVACGKGFSCLANEGNDIGPVEPCTIAKFSFIICLNNESCSYKEPYSTTMMCTCPVRKEVYRKYRK